MEFQVYRTWEWTNTIYGEDAMSNSEIPDVDTDVITAPTHEMACDWLVNVEIVDAEKKELKVKKGMKQEDKDLLLRYLSMALPYGVIINTPNGDGYLNSINQTIFGNEYGINIKPTRRDYFNDKENNFKPYLRPLASMTEEELEELNCLCYHNISVQDDILCGYICGIEITDVQNFLLRYHFDFMGLIPKGLAIEVTEENNPYNMTEE